MLKICVLFLFYENCASFGEASNSLTEFNRIPKGFETNTRKMPTIALAQKSRDFAKIEFALDKSPFCQRNIKFLLDIIFSPML